MSCETVFEEEGGDHWPVQKCHTDQKRVTKYSPETTCREVSRQLCAPRGCAEKEVELTLGNQAILIIHSSVKVARPR